MRGEKVKITRGKVAVLGVLVILAGLWLSGTLTIIYNAITSGEIPQIDAGGLALGSILTGIGPWIIKFAFMLPKGGG
jgi:hypothetical protein